MSKPVLTSLCYAKPVLNIASDNTLSLFSSKQTNPACWPYRVPTRMLKKTMGFVVEHQVFLIEQKCQSRSPHKLCKVVTCLVQTVLEDPHLVNKIHTCFKLKIVNLKDEIRKFNMLAHFWGGGGTSWIPSFSCYQILEGLVMVTIFVPCLLLPEKATFMQLCDRSCHTYSNLYHPHPSQGLVSTPSLEPHSFSFVFLRQVLYNQGCP